MGTFPEDQEFFEKLTTVPGRKEYSLVTGTF